MRVALRHAARRAADPDEPVFRGGDLKIDLARRRVFVGDEEVRNVGAVKHFFRAPP